MPSLVSKPVDVLAVEQELSRRLQWEPREKTSRANGLEAQRLQQEFEVRESDRRRRMDFEQRCLERSRLFGSDKPVAGPGRGEASASAALVHAEQNVEIARSRDYVRQRALQTQLGAKELASGAWPRAALHVIAAPELDSQMHHVAWQAEPERRQSPSEARLETQELAAGMALRRASLEAAVDSRFSGRWPRPSALEARPSPRGRSLSPGRPDVSGPAAAARPRPAPARSLSPGRQGRTAAFLQSTRFASEIEAMDAELQRFKTRNPSAAQAPLRSPLMSQRLL